MNYYPIIAVLLVMTLGYGLFLKVLLDRQIIALSWRVVYVVAGCAIFLEIAFLASRFIDSQVVRWLFHLNKEKNITTTFMTLLLISIGVTGLLIAFKLTAERGRWRGALYWYLVGAFFIFLAFDEYYVLHERVANWHLLYTIIGVILAAITLLNAWVFDRPNLHAYALIVLGLASIGLGGIGFDWSPLPIPFGFVFRYVIEEYLEYIGASLILFIGLTYLRQHFDTMTWRFGLRALFVANAVWLVSSIFVTFWPLSWLEIQQSAEEVTVSFIDGDLSLVAYRVEPDEWVSGQDVRVSEYWRASAPLYGTYAHALKLLDPETGEVVKQFNIPMHPELPPTEGWIPGLIYKKVVDLSLDDIPPDDYLLALQAWEEPAATVTLTISQGDYVLVQPDTVVLKEVTIRPG